MTLPKRQGNNALGKKRPRGKLLAVNYSIATARTPCTLANHELEALDESNSVLHLLWRKP